MSQSWFPIQNLLYFENTPLPSELKWYEVSAVCLCSLNVKNRDFQVRGRSQFTFTHFCKFLTTHLPLVYNHLHSTDHLPICKCLHMSVDQPHQYVPHFSHANCNIQGMINDFHIVCAKFKVGMYDLKSELISRKGE